jgi:hypothetical protein
MESLKNEILGSNGSRLGISLEDRDQNAPCPKSSFLMSTSNLCNLGRKYDL